MKRLVIPTLALAMGGVLLADEGMWTFDNVPKDAIARKYKVTLTDRWLQQVRQSVVRLESGCTGSFVSANGLILTNHHCAAECLTDLSTAQRDYIAQGFSASAREAEVRCPGEQVSVLTAMQNVTPQVTKAIANVPPAETVCRTEQDTHRARGRLRSGVEEGRCAAQLRSGHALPGRAVLALQVQALRRRAAGRSHRRTAIAAFGGDPDNFQFPRWCLDMSLLRAYENGKPAATPTHLNDRTGHGAGGRRAGLRRRASGDDATAADGRAAQDPARRLICRSGCCASPSCAAG